MQLLYHILNNVILLLYRYSLTVLSSIWVVTCMLLLQYNPLPDRVVSVYMLIGKADCSEHSLLCSVQVTGSRPGMTYTSFPGYLHCECPAFLRAVRAAAGDPSSVFLVYFSFLSYSTVFVVRISYYFYFE